MTNPETITTVQELETHYQAPNTMALRKVADYLSPAYLKWIGQSRFCVLTTVGPDGTDATPRGDDGPVVHVLDGKTLAMPDWSGNNRLDSLKNIVRDPRVSLMFMVAGSNNVVRINGTATVTAASDITSIFAKVGRVPCTVILIQIEQVYFQCGRALVRSGLWTKGDQSADLPSAGQMLAEMTDGEAGGETYDQAWAERAARTLW